MRHRPIDRRSLLKGIGASLALPWLEAMTAGCAPPEPAPSQPMPATPSTASTPFVVFFFAHGVVGDAWFPPSRGERLEVSGSLEPLRPYQDSVTVLRGLSNQAARSTPPSLGPHSTGAGTLLTGRPATPLSAGGPSIDRVIAGRLGAGTRLRSLSVNNEGPVRDGVAEGANSVLFHSLSWDGVGRPVAPVSDPSTLFDRIFRPGVDAARRRAARNQSVLDAVRGHAAELGARLGREDRARMDEYLSAVREVERAVSGEAPRCAAVGAIGDALAGASRLSPPERARLNMRLMVLALQCDVTRVACFALSNALNDGTLPWIKIDGGHHDLSHETDAASLDRLRQIDRYHAEQLAYLLGLMRAVVEPDGTLLDRVALVCTSEVARGYNHDFENLPVILAGRARGRWIVGRDLQLSRPRSLGDLWATVPQVLGEGDLQFRPDGASPISELRA